MKRTNVILDEELLDEACRVLGEKTYSGAINKALSEVVKKARIKALFDLQGSGAWEGPPELIPPGHYFYDELVAEAKEREARREKQRAAVSAMVRKAPAAPKKARKR